MPCFEFSRIACHKLTHNGIHGVARQLGISAATQWLTQHAVTACLRQVFINILCVRHIRVHDLALPCAWDTWPRPPSCTAVHRLHHTRALQRRGISAHAEQHGCCIHRHRDVSDSKTWVFHRTVLDSLSQDSWSVDGSLTPERGRYNAFARGTTVHRSMCRHAAERMACM